MATLIRRDAWQLGDDPWHPLIEAYARGVAVMQDRDAEDPTSWAYQAAIHGSDEADQFRNQCQHNSWFFLPWHRMYLYWFERTVRAALTTLTDISDDMKATWTLPYWNYDGGGESASLPPGFREQKLSDGVTNNPLFVAQRDPNLNAGAPLPTGPVGITSPAAALHEQDFARSALPGQTVGFGGPVTQWHHFREGGIATPGALEQTPHNDVHGAVGGQGGLMGALNTAPLDPIFWLHHANIDRLWVVWLKQSGRSNPTEADWSNFKFDFHNEAGAPLQSTVTEVLETESLGYAYEDVGVPAEVEELVGERRELALAATPPENPPELVGATEDEIELSGVHHKVDIPVEAPAGPLRELEEVDLAAETPHRVFLSVEDIRGERNPGLSYAVFVNLPDDDGDHEPEKFYVGNISFFGIEEARDVSQDHLGGHGLRYTFDISDLVARLQAAGHWNPDQVRVTFSPIRVQPVGDAARAEPAPDEPTIRVGRIGIYSQ